MSGYNYGDRGYPDRRYESSRGSHREYRGGRDSYRGSLYRGRGRGAPRGRDFRREFDPRDRDPRDTRGRHRDLWDRDYRERERDPRERDPRDLDPRDRDPRDRDPRDYREPREYKESREDDRRDDRREEFRDREPSYSRPPIRDRDSSYSDYRERELREFSKEPSRSKSVSKPKHENSSPRHSNSGLSPRGSRDHGSTPTYTDPWISILHIRDNKVALRLEARHKELANVNTSLGLLQAEVHKLKAHMDLLDVYAKRDSLNVEMTTEKLDEFTFL